MKIRSIYFIVLLFLSYITFRRVLGFTFWVDDTHLLWASLYNIKSSYWYYNHPGLPLEFLILSRLFGQNYVWWQVWNIILKALVAYYTGIFAYSLTKSKVTSILAGLFFAVSYVGLEVVDSPIMNIAGIAAIPILLSFHFGITSIEKNKKNIFLFFLMLLSAFILDPGRSISVFLLLPLLYLVLPSNENKKYIHQRVIGLLKITGIPAIVIFAFWFLKFESNSQIMQGVMGMLHDPSFFFSKINRTGNLFAAVSNIYIGLVYSLQQNEQDTGVYQKFFGWTGVIIFILGCISFLVYRLRGSKKMGIICFFILWTFIFYLPNWFSEPRAPMAGPHRYVFLSSIGFICLVAYLLSQFKRKVSIIFFSIVFILLNIYKAEEILAWQSTYRSKVVVETIWQTIDIEVPLNANKHIFFFTGQNPWFMQSVYLFGTDRFMLRRSIDTLSIAPILVGEEDQILPYICHQQIHISDVFAWNIQSPGVAVSRTKLVRERLTKKIIQGECDSMR